MIDHIEEYVYPHAVGGTQVTAYAVVTIRGKDWWLCINDDGTPFFMASDGSTDEH
jgi:hypothetical protein